MKKEEDKEIDKKIDKFLEDKENYARVTEVKIMAANLLKDKTFLAFFLATEDAREAFEKHFDGNLCSMDKLMINASMFTMAEKEGLITINYDHK